MCAQFAVHQSQTPAQLVQNVLTGSGITPQNISFNGNQGNQISTQLGFFTGGTSIFGIESGIILATGGANIALGPNNTSTAFVPVNAGDVLNLEPDLAQIVAPVALRDVAVLEFDFVAQGDSLQVKYVFASEEYNDHTCSVYNDVFGFFISGPDISGTFLNGAKNVALVPGSNTPVAINTVNLGVPGQYGAMAICNAASATWQSNSIYFVNNESNPDPATTQFDGFTKPFMIKIPVQCGETYHIKFAVADAVDNKNDSAVLIEAQSFSSSAPVEISATVINPNTDGNLLEGCSAIALTVSRRDSTQAENIFLRSSGLDNADAVLADMPSSIHFPAGVGAVSVQIATYNDHVFQSLRNFKIQALKPAACSVDTAVFSAGFTISDFPPMTLGYDDELFIECKASGSISVSPQGGNPPYAITWQQEGYSGFEIMVNPDFSVTMQATVTDHCNLNSQVIEIDIERETFPEMKVVLSDSVLFDCVNPVYMNPLISGGSSDRTYYWIQDGVVLSHESDFGQVIPSVGALTLTIVDRCVSQIEKQIMAVYIEQPLTASLGNDTIGNCAAQMAAKPLVTGGFEPLTYHWFHNGILVDEGPEFSFTPLTTSRITLVLTDACEQQATDYFDVYVYLDPLLVNLPENAVICRGERIVLTPHVTGGYGSYAFHWPQSGGTSGTVSFIPQMDVEYTVEVVDECGHTASASTLVQLIDVKADFDFDYFSPHQTIINHSSTGCTYTWTLPDGSISTLYEPVFEFGQGETTPLVLLVGSNEGCEDQTIRFFDPPMTIFIPTAFTPDGDGLNDIFKAEGLFVSDFHFMVFDRWGAVVFETRDINTGWNGASPKNKAGAVANDVYSYKYTATSWSGEIQERIGMVTVIR